MDQTNLPDLLHNTASANDGYTAEDVLGDDRSESAVDVDARISIKASDLDEFYEWCEDGGRQLSEDQKTSLVRFTVRWKARVNKFNTENITWGWERWKNTVIYEQNEERNQWMTRLRGIADRSLGKPPAKRDEADIRKIRDYLKSVAAKKSKLSSLNQEELDVLARTVAVSDHKKGDVLFLQGQHGDLYYVMVSGVLDLFAAPNHAAAAENLENHSSRNFVSRVPDDFNHSDFGNRVASLYPVSKKKTKNMAFGKYTCLFLFSCFMRLPSRRLI
jgi:hypothetical protein